MVEISLLLKVQHLPSECSLIHFKLNMNSSVIMPSFFFFFHQCVVFLKQSWILKAPRFCLSLFRHGFVFAVHIYLLATYFRLCNSTGVDILNKHFSLGLTRRYRKGFSLAIRSHFHLPAASRCQGGCVPGDRL